MSDGAAIAPEAARPFFEDGPHGKDGPHVLDIDPSAAAAVALESAMRAIGAKNGEFDVDPDKIERDLARLVLSLIEFIRRLLEAQAIRRLEAGRLSADEEERLGLALMRARARLREIAGEFGLDESELGLELGPLGRLF